MSYGYLLEAEYESGLILTETEQDRSPYEATENFFAAIRHGSATEAGHGAMVRFSLIPVEGGERFDVDWTQLAGLTNPRPIYFRRMASTINVDGTGDPSAYCNFHGFGYQYNDENGENIEVIQEIQ